MMNVSIGRNELRPYNQNAVDGVGHHDECIGTHATDKIISHLNMF
jgi:hypothetical protein